jgi:hypothetical protein
MSIHDIGLDAVNVSLALENPKDLTPETGSGNAHDIVTSTKSIL